MFEKKMLEEDKITKQINLREKRQAKKKITEF